jgi:chorismate-pyruvate lyase
MADEKLNAPSLVGVNWPVVVASDDSVTRRLKIPGGWMYRVERLETIRVAASEIGFKKFAAVVMRCVPDVPGYESWLNEADWELVTTNEDSVTRRLRVPGGWLYRVERFATISLGTTGDLDQKAFAAIALEFVPYVDGGESLPSCIGEWEVVVTIEDSVTRRLRVPGGWMYRVERLENRVLGDREDITVKEFAAIALAFAIRVPGYSIN